MKGRPIGSRVPLDPNSDAERVKALLRAAGHNRKAACETVFFRIDHEYSMDAILGVLEGRRSNAVIEREFAKLLGYASWADLIAAARAIEILPPPPPSWIKAQMEARRVTQRDIARKLHLSESTISSVINGIGHSSKVEAALADALGYDSWSALAAAAKGGT